MTNLVVGATGNLGGEICRLLATKGDAVRAFTRKSSDPGRVDMLRQLGAEIVTGDLTLRESVDAACVGVHTIFSTASALGSQQPGDSVDGVDRSGQLQLVDSATRAGVSRFIYVSVLGLENNSPFSEAKLTMEESLQRSGLSYTILQPSCFMDAWLTPEYGFDYVNGNATIYGDGTSRMRWVLSGDVARFAVESSRDPATFDAVLPVRGPDLLSATEVVEIFSAAVGQKFEINYVPVEHLEAQRSSTEDPTEKSIAALMLRYASGDPQSTEDVPVGFAFEPTSVAEFARRVLGA